MFGSYCHIYQSCGCFSLPVLVFIHKVHCHPWSVTMCDIYGSALNITKLEFSHSALHFKVLPSVCM